MPEVSIVLPIYNEASNIEPLINEIRGVMELHKLSYEVLAIDDGSTDLSLSTLKALAERLPQLRIYSFRTNRGQSAAFDAGFRLSKGNIIITMDADGQNDPADIPRLVNTIRSGYDFVTGVRARRKDGLWMRKLPSWIANRLIRVVTGTQVTDLGCSLKAYRSEIASELFLYGEMHRFVSIMAEAQGARITELDVNHRPRLHGKSKYTIMRTFKVLLDLITMWFFLNYHTKPIYVFGGLSVLSFTISSCMAMYVLYEKYAHGFYVHRNPLFIIAAVLAVVAVQFIVFGLIAEMLVRTYFESQSKRPYTFKLVVDRAA